MEPYVINYLDWAEDLFDAHNSEDEYYTGQTYADQPQEEIDALTGLATRGTNGDLLIKNHAQPFIEDILAGSFLNGTELEFTTALGKVLDNPTTTFDADVYTKLGGKLYYIGDLSGDNLAQELSNITKYKTRMEAYLYADNYRNERIKQNNVIPLGIEYGKQDVIDAEILRNSGLRQRVHDQGKLADDYNLWVGNQITRVRYLDVFGNAVSSLVGAEQSRTEPYWKPSPVVGMIGGAMSGGSLGFTIGGMSGLAIGAIAGGIFGLLSS